jgi:GNAT superfamily N-acetyltransferase
MAMPPYVDPNALLCCLDMPTHIPCHEISATRGAIDSAAITDRIILFWCDSYIIRGRHMSESYTLALEETPDQATIDAVRAGLEAYNRAYAADATFQPLALLLRDAGGELLGGLLGGTYWGWLYIEILWLDERARRQGYGSRMLAAAEREATSRGCHGVHLDTMSFQALPFYERHGYSVFGVIEDMPRGHQRYFLKKALSQ